ncbi:type I glutamate--ammonia ligase [Myxococcota bacterium]|nr:type I glutamate--ammonia ligase [Myxococcota bacterium]MBU1430134.1 type I glutamate--ammonia ligase [Myxococcota bacterium]MBU1896905.1 type I glutamate--ammonia ligase [Myxococcota bacterium]
MSLTRLQEQIRREGIEYLDLKFSDLLGFWHHITLPAEALGHKLFEDGVGVDGSSLPGFARIERGDMVVIPDPETAFIDPFFDAKTLSLVGDIFDVGATLSPYSRNPRRVAADAARFLDERVPGAEFILGPEFEFYVFDRVGYHQGPDQGFYKLVTHESKAYNPHEADGTGYSIPYKGGYHAAPPLDRTHNLRSEITTMLKAVGVGLKYHHHEVGGASQHEIEVKFSPLLRMADQAMLVKYFIKNHCARRGRSATFMPKPLFNEPGSGLHVHQFLSRDGISLFHDAEGLAGFSEMGRHFMGGLLAHADAVLAFTNPSTNSYKRLIPGFEAPVAGTYSVGNRTACIRIPGYLKDPATTRFEFRPPDGTMNPYLAFAAMLMAGLDGVARRIEPGAPLDRNLDAMRPEELAEIRQLPTSLTQALDALEGDHAFLLEGGVFTPDLIEAWVTLKRRDVEHLRVRPTPYEFEMYYAL